MYINNNIKKYRNEYGYTQHQLAELIGGDDCQISRYENGEQIPPGEKLIKMASIFHISVEELLGTKIASSRDYTEEGLPILYLKNAEVVRRQFFSQVNDEAVTIYPDGIRFATTCIRKWEQVEYIDIIVERESNLLIVRASDEDDIDAQRWCRIKDGRRYGRKITGREFSKRLYKLMNWSRGYIHKISGLVGVNGDDPNEQLWYFELKEAIAIPTSEKARTKMGVRNDEIDEKTIKVLENIDIKKMKERAERKEITDAGRKPGPVTQYLFYPDEWGQYTFGLSTEEHGVIPSANIGRKT